MNRHPFFFIVDDGGFSHVEEAGEKGIITMETYENIVKLAKEFGTRIPVCFTMQYLDRENVSGVGTPLDYAGELAAFLKENTRYIEVGYHGLTHEYNACAGEFFCLTTGEKVPEEVQRDHVEKSSLIFQRLGIPFPSLFVPPYHAWEEGVTDKIISEYGGTTLVSYKRFSFRGKNYMWKGSTYMEFFPRTSIGLNGEDVNMHPNMARKIPLFLSKTLPDFMLSHIVSADPAQFFERIRIYKTLRIRPVHSYMSHIGNFSGKGALDVWRRVLDTVLRSKALHLCKSSEEAAVAYKQILHHD